MDDPWYVFVFCPRISIALQTNLGESILQEPLVQCIDSVDIHLQMQPWRRFVALELHTQNYSYLLSSIFFVYNQFLLEITEGKCLKSRKKAIYAMLESNVLLQITRISLLNLLCLNFTILFFDAIETIRNGFQKYLENLKIYF